MATKENDQRSLRGLDRWFTLGGLALVVIQAAVMAANPYMPSMSELRLQLAILFAGLAVNQFGLWNVAGRMSSTRKYQVLRDETDRFIDLVKRLNSEAVAGDRESMKRTIETMHRSVEMMSEVAGREDATAPVEASNLATAD